MINLFRELKRRNVYKVAAAYAVVGWLVIQVATQVFPFFEIPNWGIRLIVLVVVIGFPIALAMAWAFELTPEGLKRTNTADRMPPATSKPRAWIFIVLFAAAASLGLFFLGRYSGSRPVSNHDASGGTGTASLPEKSIAVLPFDNLSDEKANAYFAEGIQDEILTRLAKIGALKVISRSSTKQYQSKPGNLREIAQQLGVANILEGSVQKAGSAVHVNVQLIKAMTDDHLWAESYDRTLDNIFGVEGEIAQTVAEALKAKLTGAEEKVLAQKPTNNAAAYEAYLRGTAQYLQISDEVQKGAVTSFEEAVRLDPQFALAWAALSRANSRLFFSSNEMTAVHRAAAEKALNEAMRLQPDLAETQLARASYQYWVLRDYPGALEMLRKLQASWPNNADILETIAFISARLGHWPEALDNAERSMALNPKDLYSRLQAIHIARAMREFPKVIALIDGGLQIWPNDRDLLGNKALVAQAKGQLDEADSILKNLPVTTGESDTSDQALFYQGWVRRDPSAALKSFDALAHGPAGKDPSFLLTWAVLQNESGKTAEARANATRALNSLRAELKEQPNNPAIIGPLVFGSAFLDRKDETLKLLERYDAAAAGDARAIGTGREVRARVLAHLGDKNGAIAALEQLLAAPSDPILGPSMTAATLRLDPDFDSLRGDPRFEKLCQEKSP